jgi:hypothetical protein
MTCSDASSDADSDVLADYVLALIGTEAPADEIKRNSVENLEDFLRERAYDPSLRPFAHVANNLQTRNRSSTISSHSLVQSKPLPRLNLSTSSKPLMQPTLRCRKLP